MMKRFLVVMAMLAAGAGWAADKPAAVPAASPAAVPAATPPAAAPMAVKGTVLETKDVDSYTYLRLKTKDGEIWAAVSKATVAKGAEVTIENATVMSNFESKTLKRTFDKIVFGSLAGAGGAGGAKSAAGGDLAAMHAGVAKSVDAGDIKVAKATGPDARTVAEVIAKKAELKDKTVLVRGKVVKFTPEILGKNWIHLRDGTGSAADGTNDILVTSKDETKVGDVVLVKGVVHTDIDLGSGYSYKVLIEEGKLQK